MAARLACFGIAARSFQLFLSLSNRILITGLVTGLVWLVANTAVLFGLPWMFGRLSAGSDLPAGWTGWLPQALEGALGAGVAGVVFVPFSILLFLRVVRGEPVPRNPLPLFLTARTWRFFAYGLALSACYLLVMAGLAVALAGLRARLAPDAAASWAGLCVLALAALWVFSRLAPLGLVLPAVALDEPAGFTRAWRLGGGQAWRVFFIQVLVWAPSQLAAAALQEYARPYLEDGALLSYGIGMGFSAFGLLLTLSLPTIALALVYRELGARPLSEPSTEPV